VVTRWS